MHDVKRRLGGNPESGAESIREFVELSRKVMHLANEAVPRVEFLEGLADLLLRFSACDYLEVLARGQVEYCLRATVRPNRRFAYGPLAADEPTGNFTLPNGGQAHVLQELVLAELGGTVDHSAPCFTPYGSFWTSDVRETVSQYSVGEGVQLSREADTVSMALIPFAIDEANLGLLRLERAERRAFSSKKIESYEAVVETIGLAIAQRRAQAALRERVKELSCLYGIARVIETAGVDVGLALERIALLLPPAWQYPDIAVSRIVFDGSTHGTTHTHGVIARQSADIVVGGVPRGAVEVGYVEEVPHAFKGPFLEEEEHLIQAIAREVGDYVERCQVAAERGRLEKQLHHADRLATIGKLVAGVAHEINEPLGSILGFAQLAQKGGDVTDGTRRDLNKIIASCLQAREIVQKLKIFARQAPIEKRWIAVSDVVGEALSFVRGRCVNQGIEVIQRSEGDLHKIEGDPVQLKQVLVNLAVNAVQAMDDGGTLTVTTRGSDDAVIIEVADTGTGMSDDVLKQLFNPFFTTKDVGEGTGLGLSVVHGIVKAHGGEIHVESVVGEGSKFTVQLPVSAPTGQGGMRT
jgi:signal transduction histidine kinase